MNIELSPETESNIIGGQPYTPKKPELSENEKKGLLYGSLIAAGIHAAAGGLRGGLGEAAIQGLAGGFSSYSGGQDELYKQKKNEEASRIQWQRQQDLVDYREAMQKLGMDKATMQNQLGYDRLQALIDKWTAEQALKEEKAKNVKQGDGTRAANAYRQYLKQGEFNAYKQLFTNRPSQLQALMMAMNNPAALESFNKSMTIDERQQFNVFVDNYMGENAPENILQMHQQIKSRKSAIPSGNTNYDIFKGATALETPIAATTIPAQTGTPQQTTKQLDSTTAKQLLQEAGGDKEKARAIAKSRGYIF